MIPERLLPTTATLRRAAATVDPYGNAGPDWANATTSTITCRIEQVQRSETDDETREALVGTFRLFTNALTVAGRDRVVAGGVTYEVAGPPAVVADGATSHHLEATLRVVEG